MSSSRQKLAKRGKSVGKGVVNTLKKPVVFVPLVAVGAVGGYAVAYRYNRPEEPTPRLEAVRWNKTPGNDLAVDLHFRVKNVGKTAGPFTAGFMFKNDNGSNGAIAGYKVQTLEPGEVAVLAILNGATFYALQDYAGFAGSGDYSVNQNLERVSFRDFSVTPPDPNGSY